MTKLNKIGALLDKFCSKVGTKFLVKWRRDIFFIALIWCAIIAVFCRPKRMELFFLFFLSFPRERLTPLSRIIGGRGGGGGGASLKALGSILHAAMFVQVLEGFQGAPN